MQSKATTVDQYIRELPEDRRVAIQAIRKVILDNLDRSCQEGMAYGMIGYSIPHSIYPPGYHCDPRMPLGYLALASQKRYMSLYLGWVYCGCDGSEPTEHATWFKRAWAAAGKRLDMGKSCVRFKSLDDVPLDVLAEAIRRVPVKDYIAFYAQALARMRKDAAKRSAARKSGTGRAMSRQKPGGKVAKKKAKVSHR